jgi:hypothetical protein
MSSTIRGSGRLGRVDSETETQEDESLPRKAIIYSPFSKPQHDPEIWYDLRLSGKMTWSLDASMSHVFEQVMELFTNSKIVNEERIPPRRFSYSPLEPDTIRELSCTHMDQ